MKKSILIFNPTPNEFEGVSRHLAAADFQNIEAKTFFTGMGKVNMAFAVAAEVSRLRREGREPDFILGVGTAGSLSRALRSGDVIVSDEAVIADWQMVDDRSVQHAPYATLDYGPLDAAKAGAMKMSGRDQKVKSFIESLPADEFKRGGLLSSDTFVSGLNNKLSRGEQFQCVACDMESGVIAYLADEKLGHIPWFNVRVVADTLDESFSHYVDKEIDMVDVLGRKLVTALSRLDTAA